MTDVTDVIPQPVQVTSGEGGFFTLGPETGVVAEEGTGTTERWLRATLGAATGLPLAPGTGDDGVIRLSLDAALPEEGYLLDVAPTGVRLTGGGPAGLFWGAQTLRQLLGPDAFRRAPLPDRRWRLPLVRIEDAPRFRWRGLMLDVARHFMPKDGVLRYLDLMAAHKLNVLHFHLTDDQGWRVEIRRYPKLTETGSWRARTKYGHRASPLWEDKPHGGYYTQEDIREIVAYAAERHITVVPEIDVPGHSQAAIAAYPELGNTDVIDTTALSVWDTWGVSPNVLAPTENTLRFYEGVFEELLELFPSEFIHIGGDECPKEQWRRSATAQARIKELALADEDELQAWFIQHFDTWLSERGRRLIGWDEILEGGLAKGAAVASWRGYAGGIAAARGARRGDVPRAAGVPGPPAARRGGRAGADRLRAHPGGRVPVRAGSGGTDTGRVRTCDRHPGERVDRGDGEPGARRLPDLPAARRVRRGLLERPARPGRPGLRRLRGPDGRPLPAT